MIKRRNGGRLLRNRETEEDFNPMESTGNLTDVMLVLAVGMMLAVIVNWNVKLDSLIDVNEIDANQLDDSQVEQVEDDKALQEKGMVYQDPETGKYYIKVEE